jgi:branched-chain amino acid transport system permease protein
MLNGGASLSLSVQQLLMRLLTSEPVLLALPAVVIVGLQSIPGAIIGGLLVGLIEQLSASYISPKSSDILVYVLLLLILMVRPWGLFGQRELGRV